MTTLDPKTKFQILNFAATAKKSIGTQIENISQNLEALPEGTTKETFQLMMESLALAKENISSIEEIANKY